MSKHDQPQATATAPANREELAAQAFVRRRLGSWGEIEEHELKRQIESDSAFANAFGRVEQSWGAVGRQATAAELMVLREQALSRARRSNMRRWRPPSRPFWRRTGVRAAVLAASLVLVLAAAYQGAPFGFRPGEYRTAIAEQRVIELEDHSRVALDAATRLKVRFSDNARMLQLIEGQAQFSVAHDPQRPFKVQVGERTIVALGTKFTVEYIDKQFKVAMLEGRVAVISDLNSATVTDTESAVASTAPAKMAGAPLTRVATASKQAAAKPAEGQPANASTATTLYTNAAPAGVIELSAGEGLQIDKGGAPKLIPKADLKTANAWREGKVIFDAEPLNEAIRRLNRYSRLRIQIGDPALAAMRVSGVFDTGDTQAFIEAVQGSLPVTVDYSDPSTIRLRTP